MACESRQTRFLLFSYLSLPACLPAIPVQYISAINSVLTSRGRWYFFAYLVYTSNCKIYPTLIPSSLCIPDNVGAVSNPFSSSTAVYAYLNPVLIPSVSCLKRDCGCKRVSDGLKRLHTVRTIISRWKHQRSNVYDGMVLNAVDLPLRGCLEGVFRVVLRRAPVFENSILFGALGSHTAGVRYICGARVFDDVEEVQMSKQVSSESLGTGSVSKNTLS